MKLRTIILTVIAVVVCSTTIFGSTSLGSFSTKFNADNEPRVNNIKIASEAVNGTLIKSGEVFSYNSTVGPTTEARGYKKAKIFVDGKEKQGFGGGVCQVSSTVYNAAVAAEMEITERHAHSKDVAYVAKDKDAATSYGVIDLKFKNTKEHPIKVISYVKENTIFVEILKA